jgi:GTPase involved in cell partitioning and DNA repair
MRMQASISNSGQFDYLLPAGKQWWTLREVAALTRLAKSTVEKFYDEGRLLSGQSYCAGAGLRFTKRVPRCFVITFLVKTAQYDAETRLQAFLSCLPEFSGDQLRQIATVANGLGARKATEAQTGRKGAR